MERIICAAGLRHSGTIFYKSVMPLACADVDIVGRSDCEVAFPKFAEEARSIGLALNKSKTKYPLLTAKVVKDFVYLGSSIYTYNDISLEIRRRITLAYRCYFGLRY